MMKVHVSRFEQLAMLSDAARGRSEDCSGQSFRFIRYKIWYNVGGGQMMTLEKIPTRSMHRYLHVPVHGQS